MKIASAKSWRARTSPHLAHQPAFTGFTSVCAADLVDELVLVFYTPLC